MDSTDDAYSYCDTFDLPVVGTPARKKTNTFGFSLTYSYL